jgi:hypothetical protein
MAGLARVIYNAPGQPSAARPNPIELRNRELADRKAVESLLFDAFIPAAYRRDPDGRWRAQDAESWLVFLARHLERNIGGPDLAWWQLRQAVPRTAFRLAFGLVAGLVFGLVALIGVGISGGLAFGMIAGLGYGLVAGLVFGFAGAFAARFAGASGDLTRVTSPRAVFARDRRGALLLTLAGGLTFGLTFGLVLGLTTGTVGGLVFAIWAGFLGGCGASVSRAAWPSYTVTTGWLALRQRLPRPLMDFLADAHRRGVLRQVGAVYQFRHIELQHRLANREASEQK